MRDSPENFTNSNNSDPIRRELSRYLGISELPSLLSLPRELRDEILQYLLVVRNDETWQDPIEPIDHDGNSTRPWDLQFVTILRTCSQLYHEGRELLYGQSRFEFSSPRELWSFYNKINITHANSLLIKRMTLILNIGGVYEYCAREDAERWEDFIFEGAIWKCFPNIGKLTFNFRRGSSWYPRWRDSSDPNIQAILIALENIEAPVVRIQWLAERHAQDNIPGVDDEDLWNPPYERTYQVAEKLEEFMSTDREWLNTSRLTDRWSRYDYIRDDDWKMRPYLD